MAHRIFMCVVGALLGTAVFVPTAGIAQGPTGTIRGRVVADSTGHPVIAALVNLDGADEPLSVVHVNAPGRDRIDELKARVERFKRLSVE